MDPENFLNRGTSERRVLNAVFFIQTIDHDEKTQKNMLYFLKLSHGATFPIPSGT